MGSEIGEGMNIRQKALRVGIILCQREIERLRGEMLATIEARKELEAAYLEPEDEDGDDKNSDK